MIITVLRKPQDEASEPIFLEKYEIPKLDPSSITPVNNKVGQLISIREFHLLGQQGAPVYESTEIDSHYLQDAKPYVDGSLSEEEVDIPHHTAFRAVVLSIVQKYGLQEDIVIEIS